MLKKTLKIVGILVASIVVIILIFLTVIQLRGIPTYENKAPVITVNADSALLSEGAKIVSLLCVNCHSSGDGKLGGGFMADAVPFGEIYAANITQHQEYGISDYTDGEIAFLLRTGIKKDGSYAPPYMPKFPNLSDLDLYAIIAHLRSDHPDVQPSDNNPPLSKPNFLTKLLTNIVFKPLPYPKEEIIAPPIEDKVAYGKYLALGKLDCYACHSSDFKKLDIMHPELSDGFMGGGNPILNKEQKVILSPNLTMDKETGLGTWTEEEFIRTLRYGSKPDGSITRFPMVPFTALTNEEASAIWAYLKTVPLIHNPNDYTE